MNIQLQKSTRQDKKWSVKFPDGQTLHFGARGYDDYTTHGDSRRATDGSAVTRRRDNYLKRHSPREDWTRSGIETAGFWSRWLLWNKPTIEESIKDIEKRFNVKVSR